MGVGAVKLQILKRFKLVILLLLSLNSLAFLGGCESKFAAKETLLLRQSKDFTGGLKEDGLTPYTSAHSDELLKDLKDLIDNDIYGNRKLASSIKKAHSEFDSKKSELKIEISLLDLISNLPLELSFKVKMKNASTRLSSVETKSKENKIYSLEASCLDQDCRLVTLLLFHGGQKSPYAVAGLILRRNSALARVYSEDGKTSPYDFFKTARMVEVQTLEVAYGLSKMQSQLSKNLCIEANLVKTNDNEEEVSLECSTPDGPFAKKTQSAYLIGNTNTGDWVFRFDLKSKQAVFMSVFTSQKELNLVNEVPLAPLPPFEDDPEIPAFLNIRETHPITAHFMKSFDNSKVKAERKKVLSTKRMQNYLNGLIPRLGEILPEFNKERIPHEFIFITHTESDYFNTPGYPIRIGRDKEVGPWQIMKATGKGSPMNLMVFNPTNSGGKWRHNPCDERANLSISTGASARYLKWLLKEFPKDPNLAVLSYNWGIGHVQNRIKKLKQAHDKGFQFWTLVRFNMVPEVRVGYVTKFLAAFSVGAFPEKYGLTIPPRPKVKSIDPHERRCI